jgi:3-dehydroquinate synthase
MLRRMARMELDRSSVIVALGGGSIGDAAGFAAATFMRGIRFIQIPTTLLSMVDSSVGGKTGINLPEGKNLVGSFHQPSLVLADLDFLKTLPARERQSGVYEIVKCGLLRDRRLQDLIVETRGLRRADESQIEEAIAAAVRVKARIVEKDEREGGDRALLNFGHTVGHALEAATSYKLFTHGEAVGYGMEFAIDLSEQLDLIEGGLARKMKAAVRAVGPKTPIPKGCVAAAERATFHDKKRDGSEIKEIVLEGAQRPRILRVGGRAFAAGARRWLENEVANSRRAAA